MTLTGDQTLMREINRMAIVRVIQRAPGLSRAEIAKETGLTKSTVSLLVQDLIDEGWLTESGTQSTGAIGRRPTPIHLNTGRLAIVGAEVSAENQSLEVLLVSLGGEILKSATHALSATDPDYVCKNLSRLIASITKSARAKHMKLLGIGVGVPGAVVDQYGSIKLAPNLAWRDIDFLPRLASQLGQTNAAGLPIIVQNDYDAAALSEHEFGPSPHPDPLIYLGLGIGVGAGIVVRDRLFLGSEGFAGEVGHSILQVNGPQCSCGRKGCAEAFIGRRAISNQITGKTGHPITVAEMREMLDKDTPAAVDAVSEAGRYLGLLIQNLWTSFNPGRVVIGGPLCELGNVFFDAMRESLRRYASDCGLQPPDIQLSRFGQKSIAVGAAALVKHALLRPVDVQLQLQYPEDITPSRE